MPSAAMIISRPQIWEPSNWAAAQPHFLLCYRWFFNYTTVFLFLSPYEININEFRDLLQPTSLFEIYTAVLQGLLHLPGKLEVINSLWSFVKDG